MTMGRRMSHIVRDRMYTKSVNLQADTSIMSELLAGFANLQYFYSNEKNIINLWCDTCKYNMMIQQQIQVSSCHIFKISKFILGIGWAYWLGIGNQVFLQIAVLADIIKMSIIITSFVTECYVMEVLSWKMQQNIIIHKYIHIYCLKVHTSQSSSGRCPNRN